MRTAKIKLSARVANLPLHLYLVRTFVFHSARSFSYLGHFPVVFSLKLFSHMRHLSVIKNVVIVSQDLKGAMHCYFSSIP